MGHNGDSARHKAVLAAVMAVQRGFVSPEEAVRVLAELSPGNGGGAKSPMQTLLSVTPKAAQQAISAEVEAIGSKPEAVAAALAQMGVSADVHSSLLALKPASSSEAATKALTSLADRRQKLKDMTARLPGISGTGRYVIRREFARGGMGAIYVALDNAVGREVALKELLPGTGGTSSSPGSTDSPELVERFLREAKVTGQLEHPNIVPVYEIAARDDGTVFYTMKLVRGKTMAHKLQHIQQGAGSPQQKLAERLKLLDAFSDVCNAIAYAHSRGVIHRDLKPANIMLGDFGETLVLDWGLARVQGQEDTSSVKRKAEHQAFSPSLLADDSQNRTLDGSVLGTPAYMPPEQARGELDKLDERADVYALGAMLYELLSGRPPYEGSNARDILAKVLVLAPEPLGKLAPFAPPDLVSLCGKAMAREVKDRLPSAEALGAEVLAFRDGRELSVYRYSSRELLARFVGRHKAAVAVAAIALLFGLAGSGYAFQSVASQRDQAEINLATAEREREARVAAEARQEQERAELIRQRREEITRQRSTVNDLRGEQLRAEARTRSAELKLRGNTSSGLAPADRAENARIVSGLLADAGASAELIRLITAPVAGRSADLVTPEELAAETSLLQDTRLLAAELALLNEDFALADFIVEGTVGAASLRQDWRSRIEGARSALLARHRQAVEAALDDLRKGLARGGRPNGNIRLEDYVIQLSAYRELQTVDLLGAALLPLRQKAEAGAAAEFWVQTERDEISLVCRVLGYLELPELSVPILADFMQRIDDPRLAIECGTALCLTSSPRAYAPLLEVRSRFGPDSYVWARVVRWFNRVPEPTDLPQPDSASALVDRSQVRMMRNERHAALADVERALELEPDSVRALVAKANALVEAPPAIALCKRAIELQPSYGPAWLSLANWEHQMGHHQEAVVAGEKAVELQPERAKNYLNLGMYYDFVDRKDDALKVYAIAQKLNPMDALVYSNRSAIYIGRGQYNEAAGDLSRAIDLDPLRIECWVNRGVARQGIGDLNGALEDANRALEIAPGYAWGHALRAELYIAMERWTDALSDCNVVLPGTEQWFPQLYKTRGELKERLADRLGAAADYKRYIELNEEAEDRAEIEQKIAELEKG